MAVRRRLQVNHCGLSTAYTNRAAADPYLHWIAQWRDSKFRYSHAGHEAECVESALQFGRISRYMVDSTRLAERKRRETLRGIVRGCLC